MNNSKTEMETYAALIGMDWADQKHDVWILETATGESWHQVIEHTPEALAEWMGELQARYPGQRVAVCLEQSRGALIYALMSQAFLDLYPIHPVTLSRYREAFSPSGAKDDPSDAKTAFGDSSIAWGQADRLEAGRRTDANVDVVEPGATQGGRPAHETRFTAAIGFEIVLSPGHRMGGCPSVQSPGVRLPFEMADVGSVAEGQIPDDPKL